MLQLSTCMRQLQAVAKHGTVLQLLRIPWQLQLHNRCKCHAHQTTEHGQEAEATSEQFAMLQLLGGKRCAQVHACHKATEVLSLTPHPRLSALKQHHQHQKKMAIIQGTIKFRLFSCKMSQIILNTFCKGRSIRRRAFKHIQTNMFQPQAVAMCEHAFAPRSCRTQDSSNFSMLRNELSQDGFVYLQRLFVYHSGVAFLAAKWCADQRDSEMDGLSSCCMRTHLSSKVMPTNEPVVTQRFCLLDPKAGS